MGVGGGGGTKSKVRHSHHHDGSSSSSGSDWGDAIMRAQTRNDTECPICMGSFVWSHDNNDNNGGGAAQLDEDEDDDHVDDGHQHQQQEKQDDASQQPLLLLGCQQPPLPLCQPRKVVIILGCSHLYHETCLSAFERFTTANQGGSGVMLCPLCRCEYHEKATYY